MSHKKNKRKLDLNRGKSMTEYQRSKLMPEGDSENLGTQEPNRNSQSSNRTGRGSK